MHENGENGSIAMYAEEQLGPIPQELFNQEVPSQAWAAGGGKAPSWYPQKPRRDISVLKISMETISLVWPHLPGVQQQHLQEFFQKRQTDRRMELFTPWLCDTELRLQCCACVESPDGRAGQHDDLPVSLDSSSWHTLVHNHLGSVCFCWLTTLVCACVLTTNNNNNNRASTHGPME